MPVTFFAFQAISGETITFTGISILSPSVRNNGAFGSRTSFFVAMISFLVVQSLVSLVIPIASIVQVVMLSGRSNVIVVFPHVTITPHLRNATSERSSLIMLNIPWPPFPPHHLLPLFANALSD